MRDTNTLLDESGVVVPYADEELAKLLREQQKKKVLLVSCDVYRPAAIEQLRTLAEQVEVLFHPYLNSVAGLLAAVSAAIRSSLMREPRMPITFAWAPGYEYEVTIWELAGIEGSERVMTIMFHSRYPGDELHATLPRRPAAA